MPTMPKTPTFNIQILGLKIFADERERDMFSGKGSNQITIYILAGDIKYKYTNDQIPEEEEEDMIALRSFFLSPMDKN